MGLDMTHFFCLRKTLNLGLRRFDNYSKLLLIERQLIMLANSVVVATNWRIQAHKQKITGEKNDPNLVWLQEIKCVVFKALPEKLRS